MTTEQTAIRIERAEPNGVPAIYLLCELSWDDSSYGEDLPVAGLFRVNKQSLARIDDIARQIDRGVLSPDGAYVSVPAADVVWLRRVGFIGENDLASVPGFFDAQKDRVVYVGDAASMDAEHPDDGRSALGQTCDVYELIGEYDSKLSGFHVQRHPDGGIALSATGAANGWRMHGYLESWSGMREQIVVALDAPTSNERPPGEAESDQGGALNSGPQDFKVSFEVSITAASAEEAVVFALDDLRDMSLGPWTANVADSSGALHEVVAAPLLDDAIQQYDKPGASL